MYLLTNVTVSVVSPIRRSACRAPGSIDQPTSWPCVEAITRSAPARRTVGASRASGAAAPNHTFEHWCFCTSSAARRATNGVGTISVVGWRTTR